MQQPLQKPPETDPLTNTSLLRAAKTKLKQKGQIQSDLDLKEARIQFDLKETQSQLLRQSINDNSKLVNQDLNDLNGAQMHFEYSSPAIIQQRLNNSYYDEPTLKHSNSVRSRSVTTLETRADEMQGMSGLE